MGDLRSGGETAFREDALLHRPGIFRATLAVVRKDILLEWRGRARTNATVFFAILTLLLFSFAMGPDHKLLTKTAPGFLWLAIFLSSVMSLSESMRLESENDALEGLRLLPVRPLAVFLGKALVNAVFLSLLSFVLVPVAIAIYGMTLKLGVPALLGVLVVGCFGISAPGTLYSAIAIQARARDVLLPLLLFPVLVPVLLGAVKATSLVMHGDPMEQLPSWTMLLAGFAVVYWLLCCVLFNRVIED